MNGIGLGAGTALIAVAFAAQWLLKKRLKNQKVAKFYMWAAWILAALGSALAAPATGNSVGVTSTGAAVASLILIGVLIVDVADKRPDWPAFLIIVAAPWFMRWTGGPLGQLFDVILTPMSAIAAGVLGVIGG